MTDQQLTDEDKQKECERICRPLFSKDSGLHSASCPIQQDMWKHPKRKKDY
jgi:hypothetical protein